MLESFNIANVLKYLPHMAVGMIGVFLIIGIIIGATYAINYLSDKASK